jgi:hypothetical protein
MHWWMTTTNERGGLAPAKVHIETKWNLLVRRTAQESAAGDVTSRLQRRRFELNQRISGGDARGLQERR